MQKLSILFAPLPFCMLSMPHIRLQRPLRRWTWPIDSNPNLRRGAALARDDLRCAGEGSRAARVQCLAAYHFKW